MDINGYIRAVTERQGLSLRQAAIKAGLTPQNMSNKIARNTFYWTDLEALAKAMGCEARVTFVDKEGREI